MIYGRQSCDTRKMEDGADVDLGNKKFGGQEVSRSLRRCVHSKRIHIHGRRIRLLRA